MTDHIECWIGCGQLDFSHTADGNVKWYSHFGRVKHTAVIQTCYSTQGICPREMKAYISTRTHTGTFIAALSVITPTWKQHKYPLTGD